DIVVKKEHMPATNYERGILVRAAGGNPPDVMWMGRRTRIMAEKGILLDLTNLLSRDKDFDRDDFYEKLFEPFEYKGGLYGIPVDYEYNVLYYNKRLFDLAEISYPDKRWDWQTLLDAATKLTKDFDSDGKIDQFGLNSLDYRVLVWQNGGRLFNDEMTECLIDSESAIEAIQFGIDLTRKYHVTPTGRERVGMGASQLFTMGRVAMTLGGRSIIKAYRERISDFEWDVAPIPKGKMEANMLWYGGFSIAKKTKYPDESWKLVKFLVSSEGQKLNSRIGGSVPSRKSVAESDIFLGITPPANNRVFLDGLAYTRSIIYTPAVDQTEEIIRRYLELVRLGKIDVREACKKIKIEADKLLKEEKNKGRI
ncbi:sugar ABC transporter substrate-binding protein, partial [candidate division WOR-3 bacterium]|nr:sugar ABC transporter substrate-binding protein [candidate division WOR-3 bacterium]